LKKQARLVANDFERFRKPAQREKFLVETDKVVPWNELAAVDEPYYPKAHERREKSASSAGWDAVQGEEPEEVAHPLARRARDRAKPGARAIVFSREALVVRKAIIAPEVLRAGERRDCRTWPVSSAHHRAVAAAKWGGGQTRQPLA
jgi:hypothetical protein